MSNDIKAITLMPIVAAHQKGEASPKAVAYSIIAANLLENIWSNLQGAGDEVLAKYEDTDPDMHLPDLTDIAPTVQGAIASIAIYFLEVLADKVEEFDRMMDSMAEDYEGSVAEWKEKNPDAFEGLSADNDNETPEPPPPNAA